jgi:tRNA-dihydrouridine synthase B
MQLGELTINSPFWLAPMAGYTDAAFRSVCHDFGGGLFYTEVAVAQGLVRGSKPSWHLMETRTDEGPIAGHIYGSEPDIMAQTALMIQETGRFQAIDINAGCPVRKIVAKGAGAALIRTPEQIGKIIQAVTDAVDLPVLLKTRIGFEQDISRITEIAQAAETAGAAALAIHGRYASQHHRGPVDWEQVAAIKASSSIPVLGNGGLFTAKDAVDHLTTYGLDGVLIARGAVGCPWIFEDADRLLSGLSPKTRTLTERRQIIETHLARLVELKSKEAKCRRRRDFDVDRGAALHFRCHLIQYFSGLSHWTDIRRKLNGITSTAEIMQAVDTVFDRQRGSS